MGSPGPTRCFPDPLLQLTRFIFVCVRTQGWASSNWLGRDENFRISEARDSLGEPWPAARAVLGNACTARSACLTPRPEARLALRFFTSREQQERSNIPFHTLLMEIVLHFILILQEPIDRRLAVHRLLDHLRRRLAMHVEQTDVIDLSMGTFKIDGSSQTE